MFDLAPARPGRTVPRAFGQDDLIIRGWCAVRSSRVPCAGVLATVGVVLCAGLSGCGGTASQATRTVTVTTDAAAPSTTTPPKSRSTSAKPKPRRVRPSHGRTACDANVSVKAATTSCAFGQNVFYGFWKAQDRGDDAFDAYSPVSKRSYAMSCTSGGMVVCRAGDGGEVRFPMTAIDAYDADQAARYAATHDTGPADTPTARSAEDPPATTNGAGGKSHDCDANYAGACLDPDALDYDCEGGSGDGPEYTGTVKVVGDDPYDLDRDGDGVACDAG